MVESPERWHALAESAGALDQRVPVAQAAPPVRVVHLPDVPPPRKRPAKPAWPALPAPPPRRRGAGNWKRIGGSCTAAGVVLGVLLFAAYATTPRAPKPAVPPAAARSAAPLSVTPALREPTLAERLAALEQRHQEEVGRLQARLEEAAKPAPPEAPIPAAADPATPVAPAGKINYGTAVDFVASPTEANDQALKHKKLVLILTISGNFEEACFT